MEISCIECVQRSEKPICSMEFLCILEKGPGSKFECVCVCVWGGGEESDILGVKIASLGLHKVNVTQQL